MRCTDNSRRGSQKALQRARRAQRRNSILLLILGIAIVILIGILVFWIFFRSHEITIVNPYQITDNIFGVRTESAAENRAVPFTDGLCVTASDVSFDGISLEYAEAGAMMDLSAGNVLFAKNVHERLYPALSLIHI